MREGWITLLVGIFLLLYQGLLAPAFVIQNLAWPMPYVLFWLILPFGEAAWQSFLAATVYGVLLDLSFPAYGLHTFCGLWVWGLRSWWLSVLHPHLRKEAQKDFSVRTLSSVEFFTYAFPLTLWHHLWYFSLSHWKLNFQTGLISILSAAYTFLWEWSIFELFLRTAYERR